MRKKYIFTLVLSVSILLSFTVKIRLDSEAAESINTVCIADAPTDITVEPVIVPSLIVDADAVMDETGAIKETYISAEAYDACVTYATEYGLSAELLMAIIERESSGNPQAVNGDCQGLMQVSSYWHSDRMVQLGCTDLYNTEQNIHVGTDYISELFEQYENIYLVLMMYNMEHDTARELYDSGVYSDYATGIVERTRELEQLHKMNQN